MPTDGVSSIDIELTTGASVDGFVRFADGRPAVGARVWPSLPIFDAPLETRTDAEGYFVLEGVKLGARYLNASVHDPDRDGPVGACERVTIEAGETLRWNARVATLPTFEVRVTQADETVPQDARVALFSGSGDDKWHAVRALGADGSATFTHLPNESIDVFVMTQAASANGMPAAFVAGVDPTDPGIDVRLDDLEAHGRVQARLMNHQDGPIGDGQLLFYEARGITIIEERLEQADGTIDAKLPVASYRLFWASRNGLWECTQLTLREGETLELGTLRAPAWVRVPLAEHGLADSIGRRAELRPRAERLGLSISDRVLHGWDVLPAELDLYPGHYAIEGSTGTQVIAVTAQDR